LRGALRRPGLVFIAFYVYAIVSVLWTDLLPESFMKGAALAITTFGAYRLATRLRIDEIITATTQGMRFATVASLCTVVFLPDIGLDHSYFHDGQWQGIFASKQTLGVLGANLMFFACYRGLTGSGWLVFLATFLPAVACAAGSGRRGVGDSGLRRAGFFKAVHPLRKVSFRRAVRDVSADSAIDRLHVPDG
jgi:exopolysaccharide production protein ExoQ